MRTERARILVVGPRSACGRICNYLEASGRYELSYAAHPGDRILLDWNPSVLLLHVPAKPEAAKQALKFLKGRVAVVVITAVADMNVYLAAMTHGAFDYLTSYSPPAEIDRVLRNAMRVMQEQAA